MRDDNEDPIKEYGVFRPGFDNLTGDDDSHFDINTYSASKGYHECSDDLSDRGSRIEEIAHAKYAEYKRKSGSQNKYNNYNTYNRTGSSKVILNGKNKLTVYVLIFFFIIVPILQTIFGTIGIIFSEVTDMFDDSDYSSSYNYEYVENNQDFEILKNQIQVNGTVLSDKTLLVETSNNNAESISNVQVQVIFYNGANQPIKVCDYMIDTLSASNHHFEKVYDMPENFETYNFAVTKPYDFGTQEIDFASIDVNLLGENGSYLNFEITNNTEDMLDTVEIGILFLKDNKVVDFETERVYDLKSGKTEKEESYQYLDKTEYDRIDYFINDVYSYN